MENEGHEKWLVRKRGIKSPKFENDEREVDLGAIRESFDEEEEVEEKDDDQSLVICWDDVIECLTQVENQVDEYESDFEQPNEGAKRDEVVALNQGKKHEQDEGACENTEIGITSSLDNQELDIELDEEDKEEVEVAVDSQLALHQAVSQARKLQLRLALMENQQEELYERLLTSERLRERAIVQLEERGTLATILEKFKAVSSVTSSIVATEERHSYHVSPQHKEEKESKEEQSAMEFEVLELRAKLMSAEKEALELRLRLENAEKYSRSSRDEYEEAISTLRQQMEQNSRERQEIASERLKEKERQIKLVSEELRKEQTSKSNLSERLKTSEEERHALKDQVVTLMTEQNKMKDQLEASHLELAKIKIDLATRRSDEDDLVARLELQAREFHSSHSSQLPSQQKREELREATCEFSSGEISSDLTDTTRVGQKWRIPDSTWAWFNAK